MKRFYAVLLSLAMLASLVACSETPKSEIDDGGMSLNQSTEEIKIGLYGTITGANALAGEMMEKGAQLAVKKVNAAGGIDGRPLKLVVYDDKSTPEGAVKAVTRMVDVDKVIAMVGSNSSPNILAGAQITEEAGVIQVGGGTSPAYTNAGYQYIFRGTANAQLPNKAFVDAMKAMGTKKVALFSVASEYGKSGIASVKELLGNDFEIVAEESYQATDTDYTGQIAKILKANPDGIIVYGMTNELALSLKQFRRNGYKGYIYGPEGLGVPDILNVAVINVHTIKPIDKKMVQKYSAKCKHIVTIEEHSVIGGLGDSVQSVLSTGCEIIKLGVQDTFSQSGKPQDLLKHFRLDSQSLVEDILKGISK